jgi:prolipoprotein diacylglyceryltransferase
MRTHPGYLALAAPCATWRPSTSRPAPAFADAAAPRLVLGQAVGRWGTYFNEEFFGRPSDLAWAIRIAPEDRPTEFADVTSFYPTFLYESLWTY